MAKRVLNRRQLRDEADQAARTPPADAGDPAAPPPAKAKARAKAAAKPKAEKAPRKPRVKKVKEPERVRAYWGVFDNAMKRVAIFHYNQRDAATQKMAALNTNKPGMFFLQIVKEPIVVPPPAAPAPTP